MISLYHHPIFTRISDRPLKRTLEEPEKRFFLGNAFTVLHQTLHNIGKNLKMLAMVSKCSDSADVHIKDRSYAPLQSL